MRKLLLLIMFSLVIVSSYVHAANIIIIIQTNGTGIMDDTRLSDAEPSNPAFGSDTTVGIQKGPPYGYQKTYMKINLTNLTDIGLNGNDINFAYLRFSAKVNDTTNDYLLYHVYLDNWSQAYPAIDIFNQPCGNVTPISSADSSRCNGTFYANITGYTGAQDLIFNLTNLTKVALNQGRKNLSIVIEGQDVGGLFQFNSKEAATVANRPFLNISYTVANVIVIDSPTNTTIINTNVSLQFKITNISVIDKTFYSLNDGINVTITGNTTFIGQIGSNKLQVYANDTLGIITSSTVRFTIAYYKVLREEYVTDVLQGQIVPYALLITYMQSSNISNTLGNLSLNGTIYNGNVNILNSTHINISTSLSVPNLPSGVLSSQLPHFWNFSILFSNGSSISVRTDQLNQTFTAFQLLVCGGASNYTAINFSTFDEETQGTLFTDFKGSFDVKQSSGASSIAFNFSFVNKTSHAVCIFPVTTTLYVDALVSYNATTTNSTIYPIRYYFLRDALITNVSSNISLYGLDNNSGTHLVPLTVKSGAGQSKINAIVSVRKFYPGENLYRLVAMGLTDYEGIARIYMQVPNYYYSFVITEGTTVTTTTSKQFMTPDGITITVPTQILDYYLYANSVVYSCSNNVTSKTVSCTYIDISGLSSTYNLTVVSRGALLDTPICSRLSTSASSTLICDLSAQGNGSYPWFFSALYDSGRSIASGTLDLGLVARYGTTGYFLGLIIFLTLALLGVFKPEAVIIFGLGGLILVSILQLVVLQISIIAALFIGMILYLAKKGGSR